MPGTKKIQTHLTFIAIISSLVLLGTTRYAYGHDSVNALPNGDSFIENKSTISSAEKNQNSEPFVLDLVTVGDPFNMPDNQGLGSVDKIYEIGAYEVTARQYTAFLNAVAREEDPHGLYHPEMNTDKKIACIQQTVREDGTYRYDLIDDQRGDLPITYVSLNDAERFCNWLENGAPGCDQDYQLLQESTEIGAYAFLKDGNQTIVETNVKSKYHIPSDNEWMKAAYYKGNGTNSGYGMHPTKHDAAPENGIGDVTNFANYQTYRGGLRNNFLDADLKITTAHCFNMTATFYQAHDMGGNVAEWTIPAEPSGLALVRGGSWKSVYSWYGNNDLMRTAPPEKYDPFTATNFIGFRIAVGIDPNSLSAQKNKENSSGAIKDPLMSQKALSDHAASFKITHDEQVFFEGMVFTGLILTGSALVFIAGEVALGICSGTELAEIAAAFPQRRIVMILSHLLVNSYCITKAQECNNK